MDGTGIGIGIGIDQLSLPAYTFDPTLSDDENFLTWAVLLARCSYSRKGHMGALLTSSGPSPTAVGTSRELLPSSVVPDPSQTSPHPHPHPHLRAHVLSYAVNVPLLYASTPKHVPEIHAEAACIARAARHGIPTANTTCYVTFPPCNECFKILLAAGVRRIVFRKAYNPTCSDAVLVAAKVHHVQIVGTLLRFASDPRPGTNLDPDPDFDAEVEAEVNINALLDRDTASLTPTEIAALEAHVHAQEKVCDDQREARARAACHEPPQDARARVKKWWEQWMTMYRAAASILRKQQLAGFMRIEKNSQRSHARRIEREQGVEPQVPQQGQSQAPQNRSA